MSHKIDILVADEDRVVRGAFGATPERGHLDVALKTKLYRPEAAADLVAREDLVARLEAGRRLPLTLVSAPVGYGKSTLVSQWLETSETASAWLSLDEADSDVATFLRYVVAAVRSLFPAACGDTGELLEAVEPPPPGVVARCLANDLAAVGERFVLVLDDYHLIDEPAVHELVGHLLRHPPRPLHLAILTRRDPPLPLASLRAGHRIHELRLADLQFDERQAAGFLAKALGHSPGGGPKKLRLGGSALGWLHGSTEGWPAGLRLAALSLRHGGDAEELARGFSDDSRQVRDYLMGEVLAHQPPEVRDSLARVAILGRFCAPLCAALDGQGGGLSSSRPRRGDGDPAPAVSFDRLLEGAGLFSIPLDSRHEWYRFHHLFRQLLRRRLEAGTSASERAALHRRASAWLAEGGMVEEALRQALAGGDVEAAVRLVHERVDEAMNRQQWHLLERWLGMIPAEILGQEPLLLLLKALSWAYRYHYAESWKLVDEAEPLVAAVPAESAAGRRLRGFLAYWRCQKCYVTGDMEQAVASGEHALELLPATAEDLRGNVVGLLALSLWARGDLQRAERTLHDVLAESGGALRTRVLLGLGVLGWMAGDLGGFERVAAGLLEVGEELGLRDTREWAACYLGAVHYQRGDLETAERYLTAAIGKPFRTRTLIRLHATVGLALCRLARSREAEAGELAESLIDYMLKISNPAGLAVARAFQAELALRRGAKAEALAWANTYDPEPILPMWFPYMPQLTLARVWIAGGDGCSVGPPPAGRSVGPLPAGRKYDRAEKLLARLRDFGSRTHTTPCLIETLAVQALLHQARGEEPAALAVLAEAVALALPGGFLRLFVDLGPRLRQLLERLELDDEGSRYVGRILAAFPAEVRGDTAPVAGVEPIEPHGAEPLTGRERDVLAGLARRLSDKEIAAELGVSSSTVKTHAHKVYVKLGVSGRRQAVNRAIEVGILPAG